MTDEIRLPPGWEWDPEALAAHQCDHPDYPFEDTHEVLTPASDEAYPTETTMHKATQEVADKAWRVYRTRWAEAIKEGRRMERERIVEGLLPWCLDCSVPVNVDEDGCCTMCGSDVFHDSDGEVQPVNAAFFRACGANHESTRDEK